ncbi:hypothetical protein [Streptomyces sclerotialus]|uniref:hypothetical protein n=1 Tax=Streptomyces sclerotialus TaxID=1957 RepID=UPI0018CB49E4
MVFGPKRDDWLQKAGAGQFAATGVGLLRAPATEQGMAQARALGIGAALAYLAVDLYDVPRGADSRHVPVGRGHGNRLAGGVVGGRPTGPAASGRATAGRCATM